MRHTLNIVIFFLALVVATEAAQTTQPAHGIKEIASLRFTDKDIPVDRELTLARGEGFRVEIPSGQTVCVWAVKPLRIIRAIEGPSASGLTIEYGPAYGQPSYSKLRWAFRPTGVEQSEAKDTYTFYLRAEGYRVALVRHALSRPKLKVVLDVSRLSPVPPNNQKQKLIKLLNDAKVQTRREAIDGIAAGIASGKGEWRDNDDVIGPLRKRRNDIDADVRLAATRCLCLAGHEETMLGVLKTLGDKTEPQKSMLQEARWFGTCVKRHPHASVTQRLTTLVTSPEAQLRAFALDAFGAYAYPSGKQSFIRALRDPVPAVRISAIKAVDAVLGKQITPYLLRLMDDPDATVRAEAIWAARAYHDSIDMHIFIKRLNDSDAEVRLASLHAVGEYRNKGTAPAIRKATHDSSPRIRARAAELLAAVEGEKAFDRLVAMLNDTSDDVRVYSVIALRNIGRGKAIPALKKMLATETQPYARQLAEMTILLLSNGKTLPPHLKPKPASRPASRPATKPATRPTTMRAPK